MEDKLDKIKKVGSDTIEKMSFDHWAFDWFLKIGIEKKYAEYLTVALDLILLLLIALVVDFIIRKVILSFVKRYVKKSKNEYDDIFLEKRVFGGLGHIVPAIIVYNAIPFVLDGVGLSATLVQKAISIYIIVVFLMVVARFLRAIEYIGLRTERFEGKPISSYIQVFILLAYISGGIVVLSMLIGSSPLKILTAFGAATAVILLIFRDTILGLVASIQISANDMVRLGDWVTMEKYGADGDVIEINLTTVKVRNFDKTITTVPTYAFIADSFKNWRGMQTLGVRRIKRSINIDISTVRFVDEAMLKEFKQYERVKAYVTSRQAEIDTYNKERNIDKTILINGRHMTNLGVFRRYALAYLEEHPKIDQKESLMVRQMQSTETGVPLEIYCFSSDIAWANYESIQGDIFDHLIAAAPKFGLRVFQNPTGSDFGRLKAKESGTNEKGT